MQVFKWFESFYDILRWYGWNKNIKEYNPNKKRKILTVFDDIIADMLSNKNLN